MYEATPGAKTVADSPAGRPAGCSSRHASAQRRRQQFGRRHAAAGPVGRQDPGPDAHRRARLDHPEHVVEALGPAEVRDQQVQAGQSRGAAVHIPRLTIRRHGLGWRGAAGLPRRTRRDRGPRGPAGALRGAGPQLPTAPPRRGRPGHVPGPGQDQGVRLKDHNTPRRAATPKIPGVARPRSDRPKAWKRASACKLRRWLLKSRHHTEATQSIPAAQPAGNLRQNGRARRRGTGGPVHHDDLLPAGVKTPAWWPWTAVADRGK